MDKWFKSTLTITFLPSCDIDVLFMKRGSQEIVSEMCDSIPNTTFLQRGIEAEITTPTSVQSYLWMHNIYAIMFTQ